MADTKTDDRSILGSGSPEAQEEARQDMLERVGEDAYNANPEDYWTVQQGPMPAQEIDPACEPQQFLPEQLPDPEGAKNALVPEIKVPEAQVNENAADHVQGPEPGELMRLGLIEEMPERETVETFNEQQNVLPDDWTVNSPKPEVPQAEEAEEDGGEVNLDSMTKAEIQEWADANGYEGVVDKDTMSKAEMIEAIVG